MKFTEITEDYNDLIKQELSEEQRIEYYLLQQLFSFCIPLFEGGCFRCDFHEVIQYMDNERKKQFILLLTKRFLLDGNDDIYYSDLNVLQGVLVDKKVKFLKQYKTYAPHQEFHKGKNKIVYQASGKGYIICEF